MAYTLPAWVDEPVHTSPLSAANLLQLNAAVNDLDVRATTVVLPAVSGGDDAPAINAAIAAAPVGAVVTARPGSIYNIATPITLYPSLTYRFPHYYNNRSVSPALSGGAGTVFKQADGANLDYLMASLGYTTTGTGNTMNPPVWIEGLCIDGNKTNQTSGNGHGLILTNWRSTVRSCAFIQTRGHGLYLSDRNSSNNNLTGLGLENRIDSCIVDSTGGRGIYVASGQNFLTDGFLTNTLIGFTGLEGVRLDSATGWAVSGCHVYATNLDGILAQTAYATRIYNNYIEGFGAFAGTLAYSSGTTYGRYALALSSGATYYSLIDGNIGNTPASSPTQWQATVGGVGVYGIASFVGGYPRAIHIHDNVVSIAHVAISLQSTWNYRCYLVQGNTGGTCNYLLHDNHAANENNGTGAANTMALRGSLASGSANLVTHHNIAAGGTFGAANSIDAAFNVAPTTF